MQQHQSREAVHARPTRQSQQRISPHQQQQQQQQQMPQQQQQQKNKQQMKQQTTNAPMPQDDAEIQEKLKAMLTQVQRGESAPRVTGAYPQGLKPSGCATPTGGQQAHHGRNNNRYQSSSVNNPNQNRIGNNASYNGGASRRPQEVVFRRSQRPHGLLGPQPERFHGMKTLVLDLDETLVHSQFNQVGSPDYTIPVDIEGRISNIFVMKRPGAEYFLQEMAKYFEVCIFTASLSKYADPLMNMMDPQGHTTVRLFREHCTFVNGIFVKDMAQIGRNMKDAIIIDNSPTAYMLQPECGLPIVSWYDDPSDRALYDYIPLLIEMSKISDMREAVTGFVRNNTFTVSHAMSVVAHIREKDNLEAHRRLELERARKQYLLQQMHANQANVAAAAAASSSTMKAAAERLPHHQQAAGEGGVGIVTGTPDTTEQSQSQSNSKKQPLINSWFNQQANQQANQQQQLAAGNNAPPGNQSNNKMQQQLNNNQQRTQGNSGGGLMITTDQNQSQQSQHHNNSGAGVPPTSTGPQQQQQQDKNNAKQQQQVQPQPQTTQQQQDEINQHVQRQQQANPAGGQLANGKPKKVTNITNIIYNFNYGSQSPQHHAANGSSTNVSPTAAQQSLQTPPQRSESKNRQAAQNSQNHAEGRNNDDVSDEGSDRSSSSSDNDQTKPQHSKKVVNNNVLKTSAQANTGASVQQQNKKRPNTGSATHHHQQTMQRQSLKNVVQQVQGATSSPGSAAVLKSKNQRPGYNTQGGHQEQQQLVSVVRDVNGQAQMSQTAVPQQIAVQMSRKSTIDTKDSNTGKMLVVLDGSGKASHPNVGGSNQRGSSQKVVKQDQASYERGQVNASYNIVGGHIGVNKPHPHQTQLQKQVLQHHVNQVGANGVKNHLKSKLKQRGDNPFVTSGGGQSNHPKVLPIEISNQQSQHGPSSRQGQPQLYVSSGGNSKTPQSALLPGGPITATNGGLKIQKNQFLMMKQDIVQGGANRNGGGMIKAFTPSAGDQQSNSIFNFTGTGQSPTSHQISTSVKNSRQNQQIRVGAAGAGGENGTKSNTSASAVRSFSQNQGSRKAISNILVYNQGQSMAITSGRNKQSSVLNHHPRTPSVQMSNHGGQQQSQILYANNNETTLTNSSPKTTANSNIMLEKGSNHSVLVEKYSNFFSHQNGSQATKSAKGGQSTPTAGVTQSDLTLLRGVSSTQQQQSAAAHHSRTTSQQMINKLRNSQNQALNSTNSAKPQIPRNLLVIPQNAVVQANSQHSHAVYNALQGGGGGSKGGSTRGFVAKGNNNGGSGVGGVSGQSGNQGSGSTTNSSRNQRLIMMNTSNSGAAAPPQMHQNKSETPKGSSQEHVPSLLKGEGVQIVLPPSAACNQLSFQIGGPTQNIGVYPKSTTHGKSSPKNGFGYVPKHQYSNPFKQVGASQGNSGVGQFVNQPHHLQAASQGLSQIMAASAAVGDSTDVMGLNLQSLYPQSQSPMSFKQMQSAKRQKRANLMAAAKIGGGQVSIAVNSGGSNNAGGLLQQPTQSQPNNQSRQSNNGSHLTITNSHHSKNQVSGKNGQQSPLQHFYQNQQN